MEMVEMETMEMGQLELLGNETDADLKLTAEDQEVWRGRQYDYKKRIPHAETLEEGQRDIKQIVGENILKYRLEAGIKRTAFGRMVGYQGDNIKRVETGGMNMGIEKLQQIANILGVTVIDLCEDWSE